MADLLPCPFCGSTNLRHEFSGSQGYIECNECGTQGPCDERAADPICDYDAAYAAWNRRAAAQADGPAVPEGREPASVAAEASPTAPPIPVAGEVGELVAKLRRLSPLNPLGTADPTITRAAALLERLSAAALAVVPVPVSERLPGDELCWWYEPDEDDDGSGYGGNWTLLRIRGGVSCYTHWLSATALPLPAFWDGDCDKTATSADQ